MYRDNLHEMLELERKRNPEIRRAVFASENLCAVTCGFCGHADTLEAFITTPLAGPTRRDVFQCPKCRGAVRRVLKRDKWGDPQCDLVPCQAEM
jgi:hypothetical protein